MAHTHPPLPGLHTGIFSGGGKKFCAEHAKNFTLYFLKYTFHTEILALQYLSLCAL